MLNASVKNLSFISYSQSLIALDRVLGKLKCVSSTLFLNHRHKDKNVRDHLVNKY